MIGAAEARAIERATTASVAPIRLVEDDGWLLAASDGYVGRANSVAPLEPGDSPLSAKIDRAFAFYAEHRLPPAFRVSRHAEPPELAAALHDRDLRPQEPSQVMWAALSTVREALAATPPGELVEPDQDWRGVFLGPGFDPADGRSRSDMLMRAPDTLFACSRLKGAVAGVGALSVWKDWGGLQGMRTAADARGGGHARAVIRALVEAAGHREVARLYLSVQAANAPALRLYGGLGFQLAYAYDYWRPR